MLSDNSQQPSSGPSNNRISPFHCSGTRLREHVLLLIFFLSGISASAQFSERHNYVLGGSLQVSNDFDFVNLRAGKVLPNENVIGLSIYANDEALSGISGWYRIVKELEIVSFPIFYKMDTELGYFDDESIGLFFSPGFTIPLTNRSYLDLSIAVVRLHYERDIDALVSLNRINVGLVFGI